MAGRPNVVLIMADQWRGDALSIGGHPVVHTPAVDQLALGGVRFERAYSATPTCIPARISLLTGLSPRTHGFVGFRTGVPWDYPVTIASEFTRHGYQTQAIGKMHAHPERAQMGFQNVILHSAMGIVRDATRQGKDPGLVDDYIPWLRQHLGPDADPFDHGLDSNSYVVRPWNKPESLHYHNFVTTHAAEFLRRRDTQKPFFLFLSYNGPHPPLDPPEWALDQYLGASMPSPPIGDWAQSFLERYGQPHHQSPLIAKMREDMYQRARAGYYAHITHVDHQINRFLEMLSAYGVRENTYICFVSDHGDMLGDHHMFRKGFPYEGSARVPLVLAGPTGSGIARNAAVDAVVELRDIFPTLMECAGLPVPDSVEGKSFLAAARGETSPLRPYLHGEHVLLGQSIQWLVDGREKYVWYSGSGEEQLFDLQADPHEERNLAVRDEHRARLELWRRRLIEELRDREEGFTDGVRLIPGRPVQACLAHIRSKFGL